MSSKQRKPKPATTTRKDGEGPGEWRWAFVQLCSTKKCGRRATYAYGTTYMCDSCRSLRLDLDKRRPVVAFVQRPTWRPA